MATGRRLLSAARLLGIWLAAFVGKCFLTYFSQRTEPNPVQSPVNRDWNPGTMQCGAVQCSGDGFKEPFGTRAWLSIRTDRELGHGVNRFCLFRVSCSAELSFTLEPSDIIAVQEQPLMLHCQVEGIPPITTQWRRNGMLLLEDKNYTTFFNGSLLIGRFQRSRSDGSSDEGDYEYTLLPTGVLQITGVRMEDSGVFCCVAHNSAGIKHSAGAQLTVSGRADTSAHVAKEWTDPGTWWPRQAQKQQQNSDSLAEPPGPWSPQNPTGGCGTHDGLEGASEGDGPRSGSATDTLTISSISQEDEAIYQCIAENSAGSSQASARLTVLWADGLPGIPTGVRADALSPTSIQVSWNEPEQNTQDIIGYVLHIRKTADPMEMEYQEAVSKVTLQQVVSDLEPSTSYSFYVKAYTSRGASKSSAVAQENTLGEVPAPPYLHTKMINSSMVQAAWEPSTKMGQHDGFKLYYRKAHEPQYTGPITFSRNYGDGNATFRFVSLKESVEKSAQAAPQVGRDLAVPSASVVLESSSSSQGALALNGLHSSNLDSNGVKCIGLSSESQRLVSGPTNAANLMENFLVSCSLNETQMSTLPLDDFSRMEDNRVPCHANEG
ncbi:Immunoglobulin superfamily DCC subclass member 3 [Bagarius yarrelli]|nr:Immunoglobulin superfamily DCC subclass member 3 [Bagarius yarrelli]